MAEFDLLIRGGTVVNADWAGLADVVVHNGCIAAVLAPGGYGGSYRHKIDATGQLVMPGGVDSHVHIGVEFGGFTTADDPVTASEAAFRGGVTTVIDFAFPAPGEDSFDALARRIDYLAPLAPDHAVHACIVDWTPTTDAQLRAALAEGVRTVKMFTTYRDVIKAEYETIARVMKVVREEGGAAFIHAESDHVIGVCQQALVDAGRIHASNLPDSRPPLSELDAVRTVIALSQQMEATAYFVHLSTPEAVRAVARAREDGLAAHAETCPHYLVLDEGVYDDEHGERFVACPPMRPRASVEAMQDFATRGYIDTVASDHNAFTAAQKEDSSADFRTMPFGMPGLETSLPVVFDQLVQRGGCRLQDFVRMTSAGPARLNGLYPRKGVIAPGSDADLAIWNRDIEWVVRAGALHMGTDYSPFEGRPLRGRPTMVLRRGETVFDAFGIHIPKASGELLVAGAVES